MLRHCSYGPLRLRKNFSFSRSDHAYAHYIRCLSVEHDRRMYRGGSVATALKARSICLLITSSDVFAASVWDTVGPVTVLLTTGHRCAVSFHWTIYTSEYVVK